MDTPETTPVIVGIGEFTDRPEDPAAALEPVALMVEALSAANKDAGGGLLGNVDSIDLVGLITWRYVDPVSLLCAKLGLDPPRKCNASMGGETPIRLIHDAAIRIAKGEQSVAAIVGGEAMSSMGRARKARTKLDWTALASAEDAVRFPSTSLELSPIARKLGVTDPIHIYPFYEMATQAAWGQTPAQANVESATLWQQYGAVAAQNPYAWIRSSPGRETIAETTPDNRMVSWPYPKLMVANMTVNQAAAVIVTSLAAARAAGVPEANIVHIWGGAAAVEPENYLERDRYDHSTAQTAVLDKAVEIGGGDASQFDHLELYSCFPVVPKMALRTLGLDPTIQAPTVTGGLTFFGGPLNNYMSHAVCAMVRALRASPDSRGLLYGQGGYVNKHHALVLSTGRAPHPLPTTYSVQDEADRTRGPVPPLVEDYAGPATVETYSVYFDRSGEPLQGIVICRTPNGERLMARVMAQDSESLALLLSTESSAVGAPGHVRIDPFGKPVWEAGPKRPPALPRSCMVERDGHLTVVTINRPEAINCLDPATNAELATIFDEFARDPDQWVAIITGAGERAFSSGNDLKHFSKAMARGKAIETPVTGYGGLTSRFDLDKPVIAAVNGLAMGGGFEIALACDLIVAADSAVFALPEPKVGLAALAGGLLRLPRQIGIKQAMGIILTGRRVSADEGQRLGFVNEVVPQAALMATARRWASEIIANSPMSVRASKEIVRRGTDENLTLEEAYGQQGRWPATRALFRSADVREGPLAFAQKRAPQWKGK